MDSPIWLKKMGRGTLFFCMAIVLACLLWLRPYFGLMDDGWIMHFMVPEMRQQGLLAYTWDFVWNRDLSWGMFRLTYPPLIWLLYMPAESLGPLYLYVTNWFLTCAITVLASVVVGRIAKIRWEWIGVGCFAWLHFHDLFMHPSLQEKLLLFFGALFLFACDQYRRRPSYLHLLAILAFVLLGLLTKASFFILIGMGLVILLANAWDKRDFRSGAAFLFLVGITLLALFVMGRIASQGRYTQGHYDMAKIAVNLASRDGLAFVGLVFVSLICVVFEWRSGKNFSELLLRWLPLAGVIAFLALFLPWGIAAYIQTVIVVFLVATALRVLEALPIRRFRALLLVALAAAAILMSTYRSASAFSRLSDLGEMVQRWAEWKSTGIKEIAMPCQEGAETLEKYLRFAGWSEVKVAFLPGLQPPPLGPDRAVVYDRGLCPLPGRQGMVEGCTEEVLFKGRWEKSFKLVRLVCEPAP